MAEENNKDAWEELMKMGEELGKKAEELNKQAEKKKKKAKVIGIIIKIYLIFCVTLGTLVILAALAHVLYPLFSILVHAFASLFV